MNTDVHKTPTFSIEPFWPEVKKNKKEGCEEMRNHFFTSFFFDIGLQLYVVLHQCMCNGKDMVEMRRVELLSANAAP